VGSVGGRELDARGTDKFAHYGIAAFDGPVLGMPLVSGCVAWLECRAIPEPHTEQAYDTCFAEVVSAQADPRVFESGRWSMREDNEALHTLHHLGAGRFAPAGPALAARLLAPADGA